MHYYTSCLIGGSDDPEDSHTTQVAYAHENHHGKAKFSFLSVSGEEDTGESAIWYCRVIAFIEFTLSRTSHEGIVQ